MKFYITLFGCVVIAIIGSIYIDRTFIKKSELVRIQNEAINGSRREIETLQSELDSINNTATKIRESYLQLQEQAQRLKLENDQQGILETARQNSMKLEATKIQAAHLALNTESNRLKAETAQQALFKQRSECILNQRNLQMVVRSYQNMNGLSVGDPVDFRLLIESGQYLSAMPVCSCGVPYTLLKTIPPIGKLVATCNHNDKSGRHVPPNFSDW